MSKNRIESGDIVTVRFKNIDTLFQYKVLSIPQATGDSWVLKSTKSDKTIVYVNSFSTMMLELKSQELEKRF